MKKMFLIPMLMMPFFVLSSCAKTSNYELSEEDRENAISMIGVNYLQVSMEAISTEAQLTGSEQFSPTVYYNKEISEVKSGSKTEYEEFYVAKMESDHYVKWHREKENVDFIKEDPTIASDWYDIAHHAEGILEMYENTKLISPFVYDKKEKCYVVSLTKDSKRGEIKFYFYKKKLIKWMIGQYDGDLNVVLETANYEYKEITPVTPS